MGTRNNSEGSNRPRGYRYLNILTNHLGGSVEQIFNGQLVYPRQLEIHLPGDHEKACNFGCYYCQGRFLEQPLAAYEERALKLLDDLEGRIPFVIYGGTYTEPLLNPYLAEFLEVTKRHNSTYGIHTNGSLLGRLEEEDGFLTRLCHIATSPDDYLSISLDAGTPESHMKTKSLQENSFDAIIRGIQMAISLRGDFDKPAVRVCYLLNEHNSSQGEIEEIIGTMRGMGVDSLRFSIPYYPYGKDFLTVRRYKERVEVLQHERFQSMFEPLMSKDDGERPFIFYLSPEHQDVERMDFRQCVYSYYQITLGADGFVYKCSSTATPSFSMNRLGEIPDSLEEFEKMIIANHNPDFRPSTCFKVGARCNRIALEINLNWKKLTKNSAWGDGK